MRKPLVAAFILLFAAQAHAQRGQDFPRIILSFNGSTTIPTMDLGGWTRMRVSAATPPVSAAGEARWYFDGTNIRISENGGAYRIIGAGNGTVTSVGLAFSPGTLYTASGTPVTGTGTLTATLNTQTANTLFAGPVSGGAAQPGFRAMVTADIVDKIVTGPKLALCATGLIFKSNGTDMVCAGDDTSPGGSSWLTVGNALGAAGSKIGSTDAFDFDVVRANGVVATFDVNGMLMTGRLRSGQTTGHAFETVTTASGSLFGYYKMAQRTAITSGIGNPGATESVMYMDSADGHVYIKEGTATAFRVGGFTGAQTYVQWTAKQGTQPTTAFASFDVRNDHPIVVFSDAVTEAILFEGIMPEHWDATTFEVAFNWVSTVTTGNVRWECAVERDDAATDIDADSFGTVVLVTTTTAGTAGLQRLTSCSMSSAAIRDNIVAGDPFRVRIRRIGADGGDTMAGDAQLITAQVRHP
jgi:hypothetical protein